MSAANRYKGQGGRYRPDMDPAISRLSQAKDPTPLIQTKLHGEDDLGGRTTSNGGEILIQEEMEPQPIAEGDDEASRLRDLATDVRDQDDLERAIGRQV